MVHIECFNMWGRTRCEICHFRYYAGEAPPEEPRIRINPLPPMGPNPFQNNINLVDPPEENDGLPAEFNQIINMYADLMPENMITGFRFRMFYHKAMNYVARTFAMNFGFAKKMYHFTTIYLWYLNEWFRVRHNRDTMLLTGIMLIFYGLLTLTVSPFLYLYHQFVTHLSVKNVLTHLVGLIVVLHVSDILLDVANYYYYTDSSTSYYYHQTATKIISSIIFGQELQCYDNQVISPSLYLHTQVSNGITGFKILLNNLVNPF